MAENDLYTQHTTAGPDASRETGELGIVDANGAQLFQQLDQGDRNPALREKLADFFAVMALRHPVTVNRYPSAAAGVLLNFHDATERSKSIDDFVDHMVCSGLADFQISPSQYDHLKSATSADRNHIFGELFDSILAAGGNEYLPFSDVIVDQSGRATLKNRLLAMEWVLHKATQPNLVIGDAGILLERGESDEGWKVVLGPDVALLINKHEGLVSSSIGDGSLTSWQVNDINVETAARTKRLLVGGNESAVEAVARQVKGR